MIYKVLSFFLLLVSVIVPQVAFAYVQDTSYEPVFMPKLTASSIIIDKDDVPPAAPNIMVIKFTRIPAPVDLAGRADALIFGIQTDIRPQHDHYGYEIRRYMAHVGNTDIYTDLEFLEEQRLNVKKAAVIAEYWKKHLESEIEEIEEILEQDKSSVTLSTRTTFRRNKAIAQTFMMSLSAWISSNERLLAFIHENPGVYGVVYPEIVIGISKIKIQLSNLYAVKQTKLIDLQRYPPFAMMVY